MPARVATQPPWLSVVCRSNSSSMPCRHTGRRLLPVTKRHGPVLPLEENLLSPENIAKEISRRKALGILAVAGAGAMLGCGGGTKATATTTSTATGSSTSCTVTPEGEEGPYFVDDSATGFNRSDIRSNLDGSNTQSGIPLTLSIYVYDSEKSCAAMADVQIDIWHCNASGIYSAEDVESTSGETWLRGYQLTDCEWLSDLRDHLSGLVPGAHDSHPPAAALDLRLHDHRRDEHNPAILSARHDRHDQYDHQSLQRGRHKPDHECDRSRVRGRGRRREPSHAKRRYNQRLHRDS